MASLTFSSEESSGESSGESYSPKRQRLTSLDSNLASIEQDEEEEEEDVTVNNYADLITEEPSESPKSSQSVKLKSSDVLDCPTCFEPLTTPIYQCKNGHLVCSSCCGKLNNRCSFCKCHIGDIRCIAMEKIIEASIVPCPNTKYGCDKTTTYSDQSSHDQKTCYFVPCSCPLPKCNYVGSYTNLKKHVSSAHELIPLEFDSIKSFIMDFGKNKMVVFKEEEEGHLFVVQAFKGSQGVYVTVNQIAPMTPGIRNFSCNLVKLGDFSTLRIGLIVQKIQKVRDQMHGEDDVMWIPPKMLRGGQHWMMEICIGNEYKYVRI